MLANSRTSVVLDLAARTVLHRNALAADIETIADPTGTSATGVPATPRPGGRHLMDLAFQDQYPE
jgi:hypothetical protein